MYVSRVFTDHDMYITTVYKIVLSYKSMHGIGMVVYSFSFLRNNLYQIEKYDMIEKWGHKIVHQFRSKK